MRFKQVLQETIHQKWSCKKMAGLGCSIGALAAALVPTHVMAQDSFGDGPTLQARSKFFGYSLDVSPSLTITDNVLLSENFVEADAIASVSAEGGLILNNSRLTAVINGSLSVGAYLDPAETVGGDDLYDQFILSQDISAGATAKLIDNLLYVDVGAAVQQQPLGRNSAQSNELNQAGNENADSFSFAVSPYIYHEFSNQSSVELRGSLSEVVFESEVDVQSSVVDPISGQEQFIGGTLRDFLNDSSTQELVFEYKTGELFDRVSFALNALQSNTEETGSISLPELDFEQRSVSLSTEIQLGRRVALTGTIGEDDIEIDRAFAANAIPPVVPILDDDFNPIVIDEVGLPTGEVFDPMANPAQLLLTRPIDAESLGLNEDEELSGTFWKAGVILRPGRKTFASFSIGDRFGGELVEGRLNYNYSSRLSFFANLDRRLQTGIQATSTSTNVLQRQTLGFLSELQQLQDVTSRDIVERSLSSASGVSNLTALQQGLATRDTGNIGFIADTGKMQLSVSANYSEADFGFETTESTGISAELNTRISRRWSAFGALSFDDRDSALSGSIDDCIQARTQDAQIVIGGPLNIALSCLRDIEGTNSQTIEADIGGRYQLNQDMSGFVQVSRRERISDNDSLLFTSQEYVENSITMGVTFRF